MAVRGCGQRLSGGVYLETELSPDGTPVMEFVVDPPVAIDAAGMGLTPRGVTLRDRPDGSGAVDVYDWVGAKSYPNVADFVEEVKRLGVSRRIARTADFGRLDDRSRLVLMHSAAILAMPGAYISAILQEVIDYKDAGITACPKRIAAHDEQFAGASRGCLCCAGLWWEDVVGGVELNDPAEPPRSVERTVGSVTYRARRRPLAVGVADYAVQPGIFMVLPIGGVSLVRNPADRIREAATWAALQAARLPKRMVEE